MIPIGPAPVIKHILAQHVELKGRMHGVAERVEDCLHVARDVRVVHPDVGHRQRQVFGERAGAIDADALGVLAEVPAAGQAVSTPAADNVALAADDLADVEVLDVGADLDDLADKLVADHHRDRDCPIRPGVPRLDVNVGAADPGAQHLDEHVVDPDPGHRHFIEPKPRLRLLFHQGQHRLHNRIIHLSCSSAIDDTTHAARTSSSWLYIEG